MAAPPITLQNVLLISDGHHTIQNAADHFHVTIPQLLQAFIAQRIYHFNLPGFGTVRMAGFECRMINIILHKPRGGYRRYFNIVESNTLIDLLNLVEYELDIQRGTYVLTYKHHARGHCSLSSLFQWHEACDYFWRMKDSVGFIALNLHVKITLPNSAGRLSAQVAANLLENHVAAQGGNQV